MPRISTFGASQSALMDLMRAQRNVFDAQKQLTTGKQATDLKGIGHQAETLSAARAASDRALAYEEAGIRAQARLEAQDVALGRLSDAAGDVRLAVTSMDGAFLMQKLNDAFYQVKVALETKHAGAFIFGGTRSDVNPVNIENLNDLVALPSSDDVFENSTRRPQVQLDQNIAVDVGMLASDVGGEIMASFKRLADQNAVTPFGNPLTAAQQTFLQGEVQTIITAVENITGKQGVNGSSLANVETLVQSHKDRQVFLKRMIGSMEDVDMADAATRFQQAQTAVDVAARTFSALNQVSLLPFLR